MDRGVAGHADVDDDDVGAGVYNDVELKDILNGKNWCWIVTQPTVCMRERKNFFQNFDNHWWLKIMPDRIWDSKKFFIRIIEITSKTISILYNSILNNVPIPQQDEILRQKILF